MHKQKGGSSSKYFIKTVRSVKTTAYDQNNNIQWYLNTFKAQKVQSPAKQFKELFCLVCYFFAPI